MRKVDAGPIDDDGDHVVITVMGSSLCAMLFLLGKTDRETKRCHVNSYTT